MLLRLATHHLHMTISTHSPLSINGWSHSYRSAATASSEIVECTKCTFNTMHLKYRTEQWIARCVCVYRVSSEVKITTDVIYMLTYWILVSSLWKTENSHITGLWRQTLPTSAPHAPGSTDWGSCGLLLLCSESQSVSQSTVFDKNIM